MTTLLRRQNKYRPLAPLLAASLVVVAACIAGALWSGAGDPRARYASLDAAKLAYAQVMVDISTESDLASLGFNAGHGARSLSALGVQEYFMPMTSRAFDNLDPAIRSCFEGQDRCTALVVPLGAPRDGGFLAAHAAQPAGHAVFLLHSGRVAYKTIVD